MVVPTKSAKNYINNADFYDALVAYRLKIDVAKSAHEEIMSEWKKTCSPILRKLRDTNKPLYEEFLNDKAEREKEGEWPRDIFKLYGIPTEPKFVAPRVPEYIGKCILLIATKLGGYWKFSGYSWRDEMSSDGIEQCILRVQSFDPNKSRNPFAYFTQVCYNAAVQRIKKEKRQKDVKSSLVKNSNIINEYAMHEAHYDADNPQNKEFLSYLFEHMEANEKTQEEKEESVRVYKRMTKAQIKKQKDKEIELQTNGIDYMPPTEDIEEEKEVIDFGLEDDE